MPVHQNNFLTTAKVDLGAESQEDARVSSAALKLQVDELQARLDSVTDGGHRARLLLELAQAQIDLGHGKAAWDNAFVAFRHYAEGEDWAPAVTACDVLFRSEQPGSLVALAHAVWISVTFPLDPALTISQLQYVIDETPDGSDGAAVAAVTAAYIAGLRGGLRGDEGGDGRENGDIELAVGRMMNQIARQHGTLRDGAHFDAWLESKGLDQPEKFLPRLRTIVDLLAADDWWIDRDALRDRLPQ